MLPWSLQSRLARSAGNGHSTGCSSSCTGSLDYSDTEAAWGFFRSLLVVIDSLVPRLWQPVRSDALLKGFVVKVGGCLGLVRSGVYFQYFFFFLVLHLNTLQQRNWKSCLKVGHSSAVSIETSSQRAVRFTSTGGAFARRDGLQPVVPVDPGPPQYPGKGAQRGDTAQPHHGMTKDNALVSQVAHWKKVGAQPHPPGLGIMPPAVGWQLLVPPYSHSSDSRKHWHNFQLKFGVSTQQTRLWVMGRLHSSASSQTKCSAGKS